MGTKAELEMRCATGTGCGHNYDLIWSSTGAAYWYPHTEGGSCIYGSDYSSAVTGFPDLFESEADCCGHWGCDTASPTHEPTELRTLDPTKEPTPNPTPSPTVRPSSSPTKNPTPVPTSPATGPTGKTIFAYPDIMNGHLHCLMDDLYPDYFLAGKNPQSMLFSSVQACCEAKGYPCTGEPSVTPTLAPTRKPTEPPTPNPTKQPTAEPSVKPTPSPTRKPTESPTLNPTKQPTASPTPEPTSEPTPSPTRKPTESPTLNPTTQPTYSPTKAPTLKPTTSPTSSTPKYWYPDIHALANHCVFGDNYEDWMDTAPPTSSPPRASAASSTTATRTLSPPTLLLPSSSLTLTRISIPDLGTQRECGSMEARQSTSPTGTSPLTRRTQGQSRSVPEV